MELLRNDSTSVEQLIEACKQKRPKAQRALYDKYASLMLGICRRYLKDPQTAENVMVAGFLKIFNKVDQYKGSGSFEGWMKRIMVNEALGYIRKNKSMQLITHAIDEKEVCVVPEADWSLNVSDIMDMINRMPDGYRVVFNLYAVEGYEHREIASKLDISIGTSKSQYSRARTWLQNEIAKIERNENGINVMVSNGKV